MRNGKSSDKYSGPFFLALAVITMLVQSVVVSTAIKGLLIPYLLILSQFGTDVFSGIVRRPRLPIFVPVVLFISVFATYEAAVQVANLVTHPYLTSMILVSGEGRSVSFLRSSLLTQGLYLVTCVLFFLYLLRYMLQAGSNDHVMKLARVGIVLFLAFGVYEFAGYLITGGNVDFVSNRLTGNYGTYSTFQTVQLGGFALPRMKSLAGEASMFAFSMVPFAIIYYYLKQRIWIPLLAAAVLSTSTTGYIGIMCFLILDMIITRRPGKLMVGILAGGLFLWFLGNAWFVDLLDFGMSKLRLEHMSGIDRMDHFSESINFFAGSDLFHQLFGYGFGYIRSTDGFSTLLVNVGVVGLLTFVGFLLFPFFRMSCGSPYRRGLLVATIVEVVMILISVTEFFYLHVWFIAALSWFEYLKERSAANQPSANMALAGSGGVA